MFILIFIFLFSIKFTYTQENDSVVLIDHVHGDNFISSQLVNNLPENV